MQENNNRKYMERAIYLAQQSVEKGGGPFGAVIVKDGEIIAEGHNSVTLNNDPTAHAEVMAIREACRNLNTFELKDTVIYTSCEPCPMCLAAIYWARIDKVYYGCTKEDAKEIGFDDSFIYEELNLKPEERNVPTTEILRTEALSVFRMWDNKEDKIKY